MQTQIRLSRDSSIRTYGMRASAIHYRTEIERSLSSGESVVIDFAGNDVTQSFVDELIGALILKEGRQVVSRLAFKTAPTMSKESLNLWSMIEFDSCKKCPRDGSALNLRPSILRAFSLVPGKR